MNLKKQIILSARRVIGTLAYWHIGTLIIGTLVIGLLATSCSSGDDSEYIFPSSDPAFPIIPSSGLNGSGTVTRGIINSGSDTNLAVSAFRIDQFSNNGTVEFPSGFPSVAGPKDATLTGNTSSPGGTGKVTFDSGREYYLSNGWHSKVLAVYPRISADKWSSADGKVSYTIDGKTDMLSTAWGEGYKDPNATPVVAVQPALEFRHLLTRINVRAYALDQVSLDAWGDIIGITVDNRPVDATFTLPGISSTNTYPVLTASGEAKSLSLYKTNGTTDTPSSVEAKDIPLKEATQKYADLGFCMFASTSSSEGSPLKLSVSTSNGGKVTVEIKDSKSYVAGTAYQVTLVLKAYAIEPAAVTIKDWTDDTSLDDIFI